MKVLQKWWFRRIPSPQGKRNFNRFDRKEFSMRTVNSARVVTDTSSADFRRPRLNPNARQHTSSSAGGRSEAYRGFREPPYEALRQKTAGEDPLRTVRPKVAVSGAQAHRYLAENVELDLQELKKKNDAAMRRAASTRTAPRRGGRRPAAFLGFRAAMGGVCRRVGRLLSSVFRTTCQTERRPAAHPTAQQRPWAQRERAPLFAPFSPY